MRLNSILDKHQTTRPAPASPKVAATTLPDLTDERGRIMDVLAERVESLDAKMNYAKSRITSATILLEPKFAEHLLTENGRCACVTCRAYRILMSMPGPSTAPLPPDFVSPDANPGDAEASA